MLKSNAVASTGHVGPDSRLNPDGGVGSGASPGVPALPVATTSSNRLPSEIPDGAVTVVLVVSAQPVEEIDPNAGISYAELTESATGQRRGPAVPMLVMPAGMLTSVGSGS